MQEECEFSSHYFGDADEESEEKQGGQSPSSLESLLQKRRAEWVSQQEQETIARAIKFIRDPAKGHLSTEG